MNRKDLRTSEYEWRNTNHQQERKLMRKQPSNKWKWFLVGVLLGTIAIGFYITDPRGSDYCQQINCPLD